jgi:transcriptional regulator with XRE-family HTH domain
MEVPDTAESPEAPAVQAAAYQAWFVAELLRRRTASALSQADLGALMGYDRTYVNKVERRAAEPTEGFARRADETLGARGELLDCWRAFDRARRGERPPSVGSPASSAEVTTDLVVERDEAWVTFDRGGYGLRMQEQIRNVGEAPVTRFSVRVWLGGRRTVAGPARPRTGSTPTLEELGLRAWCADEPMTLELCADRGVTRELCLLFRNDRGHFPLYPGQGATVEYAYRLGAERWKGGFERSVCLPTRWLGVHLAFPEGLGPSVWGVEVPPAAEHRPFAAPIRRESAAGEARFRWSTARPMLQARYRLEWAFRGMGGVGGMGRLAQC